MERKRPGRKPNHDPTEDELAVIFFIIGYVEEHGYQPTQNEIGKALDVTKVAISYRLKKLAEKNVIEYNAKTQDRAVKIKGVRYESYRVDPVTGKKMR